LDEREAIAIDFAQRAVESALESGADEAEATCSISRKFRSEARDRTITKLEQSVGRSLSLRVFVQQAKAASVCTDFSDEAVRAVARAAVDGARYVAPDSFAGLPETTRPDQVDLGIAAEDVKNFPSEQKVNDALELERDVRACDARIVNSGGSNIGDSDSVIAVVSSRGFAGAYRSTSAWRSTEPIAADGEHLRPGSHASAARSYGALESLDFIARKAVRRAVEMFGARRPPTSRVPVIFERDVAASVLSDLFVSVNASSVVIGDSFLSGKIGEHIGSDLVTIVDDGRLYAGLGSSPFDSEGVPTRRTTVFERGVFRSHLADTYYARKLGMKSTANAAGGGIGPNNFFLEPGRGSLEEIIASTPRGLLVLGTLGFANEHVSGNYSRGAHGFWIENGELAYPVDEFTIAGNLATMLGSIDAVAADLLFDSSIVSPSFRVAEMTVSGG
jgi:PmbA protein